MRHQAIAIGQVESPVVEPVDEGWGVVISRVVLLPEFRLGLRGLDAIDGTPVVDLKPYVPSFDRAEGATVPPWMDALMRGYFQ